MHLKTSSRAVLVFSSSRVSDRNDQCRRRRTGKSRKKFAQLNFKDINDKVLDIFRNTSMRFDTSYHEFKMKFNVSKLREENKLKI